MKKAMCLMAGSMLLFAWSKCLGQTTWGRSSTTTAGCVSVGSFQTSIAWCGSSNNDQVYQTTNSGYSWSSRYAFTDPYDVCNVWSGTDYNTVYVAGASGRCSYTSNAGANWFIRNTGVTWDIYGVSSPITYPQIVYLCGNSNTILKSADFGSTWTSLVQRSGSTFNDVNAVTQNTVWACGSYNNRPYIIRSTNAGSNWSYIGDTTGNNGEACTSVMGSTALGYITTSQGYVYFYDNGPLYHRPVIDAMALYQCSFINAMSAVYVAGRTSSNGAIWRTSDQGQTWVQQTISPQTSSSFNDISFGTAAPTGIAVGGGGIYITPFTGVEEGEQAKNEVSGFRVRVEPNPFSGSARLMISSNTERNAKLDAYDIRGNLVSSLDMPTNRAVAWDARARNGKKLPAGVYFLRAKAGEFTATEKVVITR